MDAYNGERSSVKTGEGMEWFTFQFDPAFMGVSLVRLVAACILGGIIGFEREYSQHKTAGFRTHILVSLGSCLVMLISQFALSAYGDTISIDPTRIGAQVVSGIGFLGAGAIIRHGVSVKGITTAASIWAVACVGLACGMGFFAGAGLATLLIWLVLIYLKIIENKITSNEKIRLVEIEAESDTQAVLNLASLFKGLGLKIKSMEVTTLPSVQKNRIQCQLEGPSKALDLAGLTAKMLEIEGVVKVSL